MNTNRWLEVQKKTIAGALSAAVLFAGVASAAPTYVEFDTGEVPGAQEDAGTDVRLIRGELRDGRDGGANYADLYRFSRSSAGTVNIWTSGGTGSVADPVLFLFDSFGNGIFFNNDVDFGVNTQSSFIASLDAGSYLLAIARFGYDPEDSAFTPIFNMLDADFNLINEGAADPLAGPLAGWFDTVGFGGLIDEGRYEINIIEVPEPATAGLALLALGLGAAALRRRRNAA